MYGATLALSLILSVASAFPLQDAPKVASRSPVFGTFDKVSYETGNNWYSGDYKTGGSSSSSSSSSSSPSYSSSSSQTGAWAPAEPESEPSTSTQYGSSTQPGSYEYVCYNGNINKYPDLSKWLSYNDLFKLNKPMMLQSNSNDEDIVNALNDAIIAVSKDSHVDARFILSQVMQESTGNVNPPCTGGRGNCGLLQANVGSTSFDPKDPEGSIKQMIEEGILGTEAGPGLAQYMNNDPSYAYTNNHWTANPFAASRCYNSGEIDPSGNMDKAPYGSTKSYVNDLANRVMGWDGADSGCAQIKCGLTSKSQCQQY